MCNAGARNRPFGQLALELLHVLSCVWILAETVHGRIRLSQKIGQTRDPENLCCMVLYRAKSLGEIFYTDLTEQVLPKNET